MPQTDQGPRHGRRLKADRHCTQQRTDTRHRLPDHDENHRGEASQTTRIRAINPPKLTRSPQKRHFLVLYQNLAI